MKNVLSVRVDHSFSISEDDISRISVRYFVDGELKEAGIDFVSSDFDMLVLSLRNLADFLQQESSTVKEVK